MLNFCKVDGTTIKTYSVTERGTSNLYVYNSKYWYGVDKDGNKEQYTVYPVGGDFGSGANRVHIVGSDNKEYFIDVRKRKHWFSAERSSYEHFKIYTKVN